jgi:hypothetical protein
MGCTAIIIIMIISYGNVTYAKVFPSCCCTKTLYAFLISPMCATCPPLSSSYNLPILVKGKVVPVLVSRDIAVGIATGYGLDD